MTTTGCVEHFARYITTLFINKEIKKYVPKLKRMESESEKSNVIISFTFLSGSRDHPAACEEIINWSCIYRYSAAIT